MADSEVVTVTLIITTVNGAPIAITENYDLDEGAVLTVDAPGVLANDTDPEGTPLNAVLVTDVNNGSLTLNTDGSFSYTHNGTETTSDSFTYQAYDGELYSNEVVVTLTVAPVNDAPQLDTVADQVVDEGTVLSLTVTALDAESLVDTLIFSLSTDAPDGANITPEGVFTWTPTEVQGPDVYPITIQVTDGELSDSAIFTVTVNEVNTAPVIDAISAQSVARGEILTFTATATDVDLPENVLTFSLGEAPTGATITANGVFSWTAPMETDLEEYSVAVIVSDGFVSDDTSFKLFVISDTAEDYTVYLPIAMRNTK
jgi:VCBS repeat-containing protein